VTEAGGTGSRDDVSPRAFSDKTISRPAQAVCDGLSRKADGKDTTVAHAPQLTYTRPVQHMPGVERIKRGAHVRRCNP
jgi:hypothetical protein